MALAPSSIEIPPPAGPAVVKRGLHLRFRVDELSFTTNRWVAKDISGSRWTYKLRVWASDDDSSALVDETVSKGSAAASGELDHYHACGATVRDTLRWEIVELDNSNSDAATTSGQREVIRARWSQPIVDAP